MRTLILAACWISLAFSSAAQKTKVPPKNYPSLLWEITGKGMKKPSYLFGTMHVSNKLAFHLSDSFYIGIKNADIVALETDMGSWQEDFSQYNFDDDMNYGMYQPGRRRVNAPEDYLSINTLKFQPYARMIEMALYSNPSMINNFLYRNNSARAADFEEDTYLDMHIYQAGKKWGKKVVGVEDFHGSMQLMKEAYEDAAREKNKKERRYDYDEELSYQKLEEAYRTGNLDWLDSINKVNSNSAAFDEKFMYKRNEIQANSIDSILKTKQSLFVGVGAAHLPGERGVIEMLRNMGYKLRPIKMTERDSRHKDEVEKIRVPVNFSRQNSEDGFFSVQLPGKLYDFGASFFPFSQQQFADMSNGSYYIVSRIQTNSLMWGHDEATVLRKVDSVLYENIPGKILSKTSIVRNGYKGFEIKNRTRRGDYQRYNIFATPFEVIIFKMSGNGDYVKDGTEADTFFSSIEFKQSKTGWQSWQPSWGGFEASFPHEPYFSRQKDQWNFVSLDRENKRSYEVIRVDIHNYDFVEEDSFDLGLLEESFSSSDFIEKNVSRKQILFKGYPALDAGYIYKDGSFAKVRYLIKGPNYYTIVAHGKKQHPDMDRFLNSFSIQPFQYGKALHQADTSLYFTVQSPVAVEKPKKKSMYPENMFNIRAAQDDDYLLDEQNTYKYKLISNDSTGEKIYISFMKPSRYYRDTDTTTSRDTTSFKTFRMNWKFMERKKYTLPDSTKVFEYVLGDPKSSRYVWGKLFTKNGVEHRLETEHDTISKRSSFLTSFFETFRPADTLQGANITEKKSTIFFQDFFNSDSILHRKAIRNIRKLEFDSTDLASMKQAISYLGWQEKKYLDVKKDFIHALAQMPSKESADYLKDLYYAAGDTIELQYTSLEALLSQQRLYSFQVFRDIMINDPPVLGISTSSGNNYPPVVVSTDISMTRMDQDFRRSGDFMGMLNDSLELTASIFPQILPLINLNDYERPMMRLMGKLIDSNLLAAKDYEIYQPKFLLEARQLMKKQVIKEKNKEIEKAQEDEEDTELVYYRNNNERDYGNSELSLYATLLMPFWDRNPAVPSLMNQLLNSNDKRLKYNTMMLLLRSKKPVKDTLFEYYAALDQYRLELYEDLKQMNKSGLFPARYNKQVELAKSRLLSMNNYNKPDTIAFLDKFRIRLFERSGFVYFFKYKLKKEDKTWKIATVGLLPEDQQHYFFPVKLKYYEEMKYDVTDLRDTRLEEDAPVNEQLKKVLKRIQYAKRNSASEFYTEDGNRGVFDIFRSFMGD